MAHLCRRLLMTISYPPGAQLSSVLAERWFGGARGRDGAAAKKVVSQTTMDAYGHKLRQFIAAHNIDAEQLAFDQSCHSVAEAAAAVGTSPENLVKNICMTDTHGQVIVAIVKGEDRASTSRVAKALQTDRVRTMTPDEMLATTGYPCGGTPSFGFAATFLIDPRVMQADEVYTGGGSQTALVRVSTQALLRANGGTVARVRK